MFRTPFFKNTSEWLLLEFYDSSEDNIDPGDKDGNQEDNLEKLDIEIVTVWEWVKQVFIQVILLMSVLEQRLSFWMFYFMKND